LEDIQSWQPAIPNWDSLIKDFTSVITYDGHALVKRDRLLPNCPQSEQSRADKQSPFRHDTHRRAPPIVAIDE
jgi:hypothetical protein